MAGSRSSRILIAVFVLGALLLGCSSAATPSPSAAPSPSPVAPSPSPVAPSPSAAAPSPSAAPSQASSAAGIELQRTGPIGCDSIGVDYKSATIRIDAASDPDVWAETDIGTKLAVNWTAGFTATDGSAPVIRGPKGEEVARDGTKVGGAAGARLAGYFVCFGVDELSVLETDPQ